MNLLLLCSLEPSYLKYKAKLPTPYEVPWSTEGWSPEASSVGNVAMAAVAPQHICYLCTRKFSDAAALNTHVARKNSKKWPTRCGVWLFFLHDEGGLFTWFVRVGTAALVPRNHGSVAKWYTSKTRTFPLQLGGRGPNPMLMISEKVFAKCSHLPSDYLYQYGGNDQASSIPYINTNTHI